MKRLILIVLYVVIVSLFFTACSSQKESNLTTNDHHSGEYTAPNGDLRQRTSSQDVLPSFLINKDETIQLAYELAAEHEELLSWIPCYCGCGESAGHRNNSQCFIHETDEQGAIVWDDHGTRCNVCIETAFISVNMKMQGESIHDIRNFIDAKYKEGYAVPTPTPEPPKS